MSLTSNRIINYHDYALLSEIAQVYEDLNPEMSNSSIGLFYHSCEFPIHIHFRKIKYFT